MVALVTGASSGIGEGICRRLLDRGFTVVALQRSPPRLEHRNLFAFEVDLADRQAAETIGNEVCEKFDVTHLVNNAGANRPNPIDRAAMPDFDYLVDLNLRAAITLTRAVLPRMRAARFGR